MPQMKLLAPILMHSAAFIHDTCRVGFAKCTERVNRPTAMKAQILWRECPLLTQLIQPAERSERRRPRRGLCLWRS